MKLILTIIVLIGVMGLFPELAYIPVVELLTDISILIGDLVYKTTDIDIIKSIYTLLCSLCIGLPFVLMCLWRD